MEGLELTIEKDVQLGNEEDIVIGYNEKELRVYKGVYTGGFIIGARVVILKGKDIEESIEGFKESQSKLLKCKEYMKVTDVKGKELLFFYDRVKG